METSGKKSMINCHTHIFNGKNVPPYLDRSFTIEDVFTNIKVVQQVVLAVRESLVLQEMLQDDQIVVIILLKCRCGFERSS